MKIDDILVEGIDDTRYDIKKILLSDTLEVQKFADFYNISGQLSWKLTPQRLKQKMGNKGMLWGLYNMDTDTLVGTIGLKQIEDSEHDLGEIGYVMVDEAHRSLPNIMKLYKTVIRKSNRFDAVYITTNVKNKVINKLLDRTPKVDLTLKVNSPFSANKLFVYVVKNSGDKNYKDIIQEYFSEYIIQEY